MKNRKKLRRVAILALVLVLLGNTIGANASTGETKEPPTVTVSSYGELYTAYAEASNGEVIGVKGTIVIPTVISLESKQVTFRRMEASAKIIFRDVTTSGSTARITYIDFDGNANEVSGSNPFVEVDGKVNFSICDFSECYYGDGNGGAVYIGSGEVGFTDCTFSGNSAVNGSHIYNNGTLTVENCTLTDGWTDDMGGAIYNAGTAYVNNSEINENNARIGGGIYSSSSLEINNSLVWNNTATIQGADLACEGRYTNNTTDEQFNSLLNAYSLYYAGWEDDTNTSVGGSGEYLKFLTTDEEPTTPTDPEPTEPVTPTDPVDPEPTEPATEEPTEPEDPTDTTDPTETVEPTPTDPEEPTTEEPTTEEPSTVDPTPTTPSDAGEVSGGDTDNSQSISTNNSTSSSSTVDSSSNVSNIDNSSNTSSSSTDNSKSESSKTENSNNSSTVNNYYQQDDKQEVAQASQNAPQPVNVTVPVNVSTPEQKEEYRAYTEAGTATTTSSLADKNIKIDAKGVDVVVEITGDSYNISISAPEEATEEQVQTITTLSAPTASTPSTQEEDKPNWVEVVTMILLGVLVLGEIKDKIKPHKEG